MLRQSLEIIDRRPFTKNRHEGVFHHTGFRERVRQRSRSVCLRRLDGSNISRGHKFGATSDDFFGRVAFVRLDHI